MKGNNNRQLLSILLEKLTSSKKDFMLKDGMNCVFLQDAMQKMLQNILSNRRLKDIMLSMKEREFRIEVGYGFEGRLNDAKAGDIGRKAISKFKNKRWKDGIKIIIVECSKAVSGKASEEIKNDDKINAWVFGIAVIIGLVLFVLMATCGGGISGGGSGSSYGGGGYSSGSSGGGFGGFSGDSFGGGGFSGKF